jgi:hypothetical protein
MGWFNRNNKNKRKMSKNSAKRNYQSLIEFLPTLNQPKAKVEKSATKFSKADYYAEKGAK